MQTDLSTAAEGPLLREGACLIKSKAILHLLLDGLQILLPRASQRESLSGVKNAQRVNCTTLEIVRRRGGWRRASFRFLLQRPEQKPLPGEKRSKMRCLCSSSEINFLSTSKTLLTYDMHVPFIHFYPYTIAPRFACILAMQNETFLVIFKHCVFQPYSLSLQHCE